MTRTKQRRIKRNSSNYDHIIRDFNRLVQLRIHKLELDCKSVEQKFNSSMGMVLNRYPTEIQNLTLRKLLIQSPKKKSLPIKTPRIAKNSKKSSMKSSKRATAISDDGYQSESTARQASKITASSKRSTRSTSSDKTKERSRSISRDRKSRLNATTQKNTKNDAIKTPKCKPMNTFVITPKVKLNSAMNVLRKPRAGEIVFSTQGSPLLVSTTVSDRTANVNVPLGNGNVVSLLPFNETSLTEDLYLDDETKQQLKILQSHLAKVLN